MMYKTVPTGTRIFLTKKNPIPLYIQPDKTLIEDTLYVAYDVRIDGCTVIPRGAKVVGDWISESCPSIAAQLQTNRIYIYGDEHQFYADSDVMDCLTKFKLDEVDSVPFLHKQKQYKASSNVTRRIAKLHHRTKTLMDDNRDTVYIEINTKEIPVTVATDFLVVPYLGGTMTMGL